MDDVELLQSQILGLQNQNLDLAVSRAEMKATYERLFENQRLKNLATYERLFEKQRLENLAKFEDHLKVCVNHYEEIATLNVRIEELNSSQLRSN